MQETKTKNDGGVDRRLSDKQLSILFENIITTTFGYLVLSTTLVYQLWPHVNHSHAISWLATLLFVTFLRIFLLRAYKKNINQYTTKKWFQYFNASTIIAAIVWGSTSIILFPEQSTEFQVILLLFVAALVAASIATLSASYPLFASFMMISLIPLSVRFIFSDSETSMTLAFLIIVYLVIVLISGRKINHNLIENIKLRIEGDERESILIRLNEQVLESEEKYRCLFELSDDPMWIIVGDKFVIANESSYKILGFESSEELISIHPSEISPEMQENGQSSFDKANKMIKQAYQKGYQRFEWIHKKKNGIEFPVEVTLTKIPLDGGDALFCVWRDITKQKKTSTDLSNALEEAQQSIVAKGQFLATMSHELRTPLNGVLGISQILEETTLNEQQKDYVDTILTSGKMLLHIINDILDYSKLDANEMKLDPINFNLETIINEVVDILRSNADQKNLALSVNFKDESINWYSADANRIRQILFNLIGNAIKFTNEGTVEVKVSIIKTDNRFSDIKIQIKDTGVGIDENEIDDLFSPFTQADLSTTRTHGGTGLGLSICKRIVDLMGGTISVHSEIDVGTTFSISLSLINADINENYNKPIDSAALEPEPVSSQENMQILLVEDNIVNQKISRIMIEKLSHIVTVVDNGQKAVDACNDALFDMIFMDVHMPVMDGLNATKLIRKNKGLSASTPIIALTANALHGDREQCIAAGMDDFLTKPISQIQLQEILIRYGKNKLD